MVPPPFYRSLLCGTATLSCSKQAATAALSDMSPHSPGEHTAVTQSCIGQVEQGRFVSAAFITIHCKPPAHELAVWQPAGLCADRVLND